MLEVTNKLAAYSVNDGLISFRFAHELQVYGKIPYQNYTLIRFRTTVFAVNTRDLLDAVENVSNADFDIDRNDAT